MPGPYPLPTLSAQISRTGITAPSFTDILLSLIATHQGIFGSDIYLPPDSQDYQMLAARAMEINDDNQTAITVYNGYSPSFSQGALLSAQVKNNGLQREAATNSTALLTIVGVVGTEINNGVAQDANGNLWSLPPLVVIPGSGTIQVTATCQTAGAVVAAPNTINQLSTVILGWQTVNNAAAATVGAPVETDAALRQRQSVSTAISSITPLQAILAAVANIQGVTRYAIYENDTSETDGNGLPPHSIAVVVLGGDADEIAQVIEETKNPGTDTYGTTTIIVDDPAGVPISINFFILTLVQIYVSVTIQPLPGYVAQDGIDLQNAIVAFINNLAIGGDVYFNWIYGPAQNYGNPEGLTYVVTELFIGTSASPSGTANIDIAFDEAAACLAANVVVTVL